MASSSISMTRTLYHRPTKAFTQPPPQSLRKTSLAMDFTAASKALVRRFSTNLFRIDDYASREEVYRKEMELVVARLTRAQDIADNAEADIRTLRSLLINLAE